MNLDTLVRLLDMSPQHFETAVLLNLDVDERPQLPSSEPAQTPFHVRPTGRRRRERQAHRTSGIEQDKGSRNALNF